MQLLLKTIYFNQLARIKENNPFFDWLNNYLKRHKHFNPNDNPYDCAVKGHDMIWQKIHKNSKKF